MVVAYYILFSIENLANLKGNLSFFKGTGKLFYTNNGSTDTNKRMSVKLRRKSIGNRTSKLFKILTVNIASYFFNKSDIGFADINNKIL